jgi:plasmid stabilization system protein ParE
VSAAIRRHPDVADDIAAIAEYIAHDSEDAARRFAPAVEATIRGLADFPGKGSPKWFEHPRLAGIRSWAVDGFPNHLILYRREADESVYIVTVIHGARQLPGILLPRQGSR